MYIGTCTYTSSCHEFGFVLFIKEYGLGLVTNLAIAYTINRRTNISIEHKLDSYSWKSMVIIALAFSCFITAQIAGCSGFIDCLVGGLFLVLITRTRLICRCRRYYEHVNLDYIWFGSDGKIRLVNLF